MASPFSKPSTQTVPHSDAKPIPSKSHPTAHQTVAEQQHESHEHINADLYRTFSPSDVAMWDWKSEWQRSRAGNSGLTKAPSGLWSKIFGFGKSTS
ncbi:hypothetical protein OEZ85_005862 [Tetradesmus obliquus]|uniref:Uncharacterized protein n=1 Tax=Tetradesmus obliquus TaxID=3088 RepID=A0ABY8UEV0_TETOB|nr:hypothetical protein OEZ85_005862 [Tetradesmus obliquus]